MGQVYLENFKDLKTEALICVAYEQALRLSYICHHIDGKADSRGCRLCGKGNEIVHHVSVPVEYLA